MATKSIKSRNAIAEAIRYYADKDTGQEKRNERRATARIQWASKLQDAGNLVLAGTVVSQMLELTTEEFNIEAAVAGLAIFASAYFLAFVFMKGGERQ